MTTSSNARSAVTIAFPAFAVPLLVKASLTKDPLTASILHFNTFFRSRCSLRRGGYTTDVSFCGEALLARSTSTTRRKIMQVILLVIRIVYMYHKIIATVNWIFGAGATRKHQLAGGHFSTVANWRFRRTNELSKG